MTVKSKDVSHLESLEDKHQKAVEELHQLENCLMDILASVTDEKIMDAFLDWQNQRNRCNEIHNEWLRQLVERKNESHTQLNN